MKWDTRESIKGFYRRAVRYFTPPKSRVSAVLRFLFKEKVMRLSRKKAIELCIELWTLLAKTGNEKWYWTECEKYGDIDNNCLFCEYDEKQKERYDSGRACKYCPLIKKLDIHCMDSYYCKWCNAKTPRTRKKYAKLFLEQIKQCKWLAQRSAESYW